MRSPRAAWPELLSLLCAALLALAPSRASLAQLPGSIELAAAGDGHLWWIVRVEGEPERTANGPGQKRVTFALMHHGVVDADASERLVTRFPAEPVALAAEGQRVVVVSRDPASEQIFIVSMHAVRNEATGGWATLPVGMPEVFKAPPERGDVRAVAIAEGRLGLLLRLKRATPQDPDRYWFGTIRCEGAAGGLWESRPVPDLDLAERVRLVGDARGFQAIGTRDDAAVVATAAKDGWSFRAISGPAGSLAPRAIAGAFLVGGRLAIVERPEKVRLGLLRDGVIQPWAEFAEPARPWALGPLATGAALIELGQQERASIREIGFTDQSPRESVALTPPSIAVHRWIHLPILAVLSVALVLAAVIFGSDAYIQMRRAPGEAARPARAIRGASLGRRAVAMFIDMLPGLVAVWLVAGGTVFDLLRVPTFEADLSERVPAALVFLLGWLVATCGDVVFGRSMGKRVMGLRIVAMPTGSPTAGRRFLRSLYALVTIASPVVMLLALLHPHGDGPAEMLSGTAVVPEESLSAAGAAGAQGGGPGDNRPE